MRWCLIAVIAVSWVAVPAMAQSSPNGSIPAEIGNRANGYSYEPTPSEVGPRERAAGIVPPAEQQRATDQELEQMDRTLLREQGMSTESVPNIAPRQ